MSTNLTDNPVTTLQVHSGGIVLCCNECGVVGHFAHNPTPEDVAADDNDHRRVHDRAVEDRTREVLRRVEAGDMVPDDYGHPSHCRCCRAAVERGEIPFAHLDQPCPHPPCDYCQGGVA